MVDHQEEVLIAAFQMMWGSYPEPVRLIHRSFQVIAGNAAYLNINGEIGVKCNAKNPEAHQGCQAMAALKERKTKTVSQIRDEVAWVSYWVPVSGTNDYYIHYTNGMNEYIKKQAKIQQK